MKINIDSILCFIQYLNLIKFDETYLFISIQNYDLIIIINHYLTLHLCAICILHKVGKHKHNLTENQNLHTLKHCFKKKFNKYTVIFLNHLRFFVVWYAPYPSSDPNNKPAERLGILAIKKNNHQIKFIVYSYFSLIVSDGRLNNSFLFTSIVCSVYARRTFKLGQFAQISITTNNNHFRHLFRKSIFTHCT
ncbi:hypothetical protein AGLY_003015 [Aphis glycines]|uniref:Uncharacterized protein n=1 Tax=Aphis glycines TaxID=307491 RepID=A0A6G0U204_APHGL|nr:hypothetical protein AGLY_003015 [Aphis glycines]